MINAGLMRLSPQQVAMQRLCFRRFMHQHKRSIKKWTPWKWNKSPTFSLKMKKKCALFSLRRCCPFFWNMASCTSQVVDKKMGKKNKGIHFYKNKKSLGNRVILPTQQNSKKAQNSFSEEARYTISSTWKSRHCLLW